MTKIAQVYETARCVRLIYADMDLNIFKLPSENKNCAGLPTLLALAHSKCLYGTARQIHTESRRETMPWERFDVKRTRPRLALACVEPMLPTHEVNEASQVLKDTVTWVPESKVGERTRAPCIVLVFGMWV